MTITRLLIPLSLLFVISCAEEQQKERPNLLFVMMDDLGYGQFAINSDTLQTTHFDPYFVELVRDQQDYAPEDALELSKLAIPTMNQLARKGVHFSLACTSSNLCAPSRLGIATGILQNRFGVYRNTDCEQRGIDPGTHLAEKLKELGYATAHIGKWHIGRRQQEMLIKALQRHGVEDTLTYSQIGRQYPDIFRELRNSGYYGSVIDAHHPLNHGFDYYYGYNNWASQFYNSTLVWENYDHAGKQQGYNTDLFTDKALDFIGEQVGRDGPFYVQLHYHAVHDSLEPKAPDLYFDRFNSESYDLNNFYAHLYGVDFNVKRIVDYLKSVGQYENTLIVFTSDNGAQAGGPSVLPGNAPFSGHKGTYFQGGFRVPMFFHWPQGINRPEQYDQLVSTMDILPTLIDVAGGTIPEDLDGRSLLPLITGTNDALVHDHLVWAGLHARAWGFLLNKSYKTHGTERDHAPPSWVVIKDQHLLRFVGTTEPNVYHETPDGAPPRYELFNIHKDPAESSNLALEMPEKVDELSTIYTREAAAFPPPVVWSKAKWEELVLPSR